MDKTEIFNKILSENDKIFRKGKKQDNTRKPLLSIKKK